MFSYFHSHSCSSLNISHDRKTTQPFDAIQEEDAAGFRSHGRKRGNLGHDHNKSFPSTTCPSLTKENIISESTRHINNNLIYYLDTKFLFKITLFSKLIIFKQTTTWKCSPIFITSSNFSYKTPQEHAIQSLLIWLFREWHPSYVPPSFYGDDKPPLQCPPGE